MYLEERIENLEQKLDRIIELLEKGGMNISTEELMNSQDIAEMYGLSKQRIYTNYRHLLPLFGEELKNNNRNVKWMRRDVMEWNELSMQEKEQRLNEYLNPTPSGEATRRRGRPKKNSETV